MLAISREPATFYWRQDTTNPGAIWHKRRHRAARSVDGRASGLASHKNQPPPAGNGSVVASALLTDEIWCRSLVGGRAGRRDFVGGYLPVSGVRPERAS